MTTKGMDGQVPFAPLPDDRSTLVPHAVRRWVGVVLPVIDSPKDPRTISDWTLLVGVSHSALRNRCRMAGLPAKRSLSLARMLRVVLRYREGDAGAENLLDCVDTRTLDNFLRLGRSGGPLCRLPLGTGELLARQGWISNPLALRELAGALQARISMRKA